MLSPTNRSDHSLEQAKLTNKVAHHQGGFEKMKGLGCFNQATGLITTWRRKEQI